jgi:hypothetical protein
VIKYLCYQEPIAVKHVDDISTAVNSHYGSISTQIITYLYLQLIPCPSEKQLSVIVFHW